MKGKILLTGHRGFIGSALSPKLEKKGYQVCVTNLDITNYKAMKKWVETNKPDYLIHLAAATTPSYYYDHPLETIQKNFLATINLAEECKNLKNFKQFIYASSVAVYAPMPTKKLNELSPLQPSSSHGVAKVSSELYLQYLANAYDLHYSVLRLSNVYGRKNDQRYFIEKTISQMLKGEVVELNNPNSIRDWIYIDDAIEAFLKVLSNNKAMNQVFLIGTGEGRSTSNITKAIKKMIGKGGIKKGKQKRITDMDKIICDYSKAKRILGWEPKYYLEEGLEKTIKMIK